MLARYGNRATIVRLGKVAGPNDSQDGLTYWVRRAARGGRVALPGDPAQPVQVVDSRDAARLVVQLLADDRPGAFHAVGPAQPVTLGGLIPHVRAGGRDHGRGRARAAGDRDAVVPADPGGMVLPAAQPGQGPRRGPAGHAAGGHRRRRPGLGPPAR